MYDKLQTSHSLYSTNEQHLQQFHQIAARHHFNEDIGTPLSLNTLDNWAVVLNIWYMFKENDFEIYFLPDKMMTYACNYFCLGLLRKDIKIKKFIGSRQVDDDFYFVLSYYLSYVTLKWVYELMENNIEGDQYIQANMELDYFLYAEQQNIMNDEQHDFYRCQKYVTHLLASDAAQTDRYEKYVDVALQLTRNYLSKVELATENTKV